jgi:hypothetical protein
MQFSEQNSEWMSIPSWVDFLIKFGYGWRAQIKGARRIALVSMPCDSAAAGLIALGALVRDLSLPEANDVNGHYDKLLKYARQYLESCRKCNVVCDPIQKQCGYAKQATGILRSPLLPRQTVEISDMTDLDSGQIKWIQRDGYRNNVLVTPIPDHVKNYHVEDEPPVIWNQPDGELSSDVYQSFVAGADIQPTNLRRSYSGLCIAGRAAGEVASREVCSRIKFSNGAGEFGLDGLLTVHEWADRGVSRVAYFNPRTRRMDRNLALPHMVVADGDASFLEVADSPEFQYSDLIGVIQRTMERDSLEAVGAKMTDWRQWYDFDEEMMCGLPPVPRGISISILRKRG